MHLLFEQANISFYREKKDLIFPKVGLLSREGLRSRSVSFSLGLFMCTICLDWLRAMLAFIALRRIKYVIHASDVGEMALTDPS